MIKISLSTAANWRAGKLPLAVFAHEDAGISAKALAPALKKALLELAKADGFAGKLGECCAVSSDRRYVLVGLGKKKNLGPESLRRAAGALHNWAKGRWPVLAVLTQERAAIEGLLLSSYRFEEYKKADAPKLAEIELVVDAMPAAEKALQRAQLAGEAVALARDLVNRAPSDKTPTKMGETAVSLKGSGVTVKIIDKKQAEELGMGSFLGVSRGSAEPPVMVHLHYKPKAAAKKKVAFVGKGITFDSGGLSLKPPQSMETMKMDMAGAASVLALFKIIARLQPKAEVHGICAFAYNMPGPDAVKPGDVLKASNGKTIEVLNTDAEGRLVLADALVYAGKQGPDSIIDLATLTGAVVVALGSKVTGVMGNNRSLLNSLKAAAERADEPVCELPLLEDYKDNVKGYIADLLNIGRARGEAGSIIGGLFLQEFVGDKPWIHMDIAGTAWTDHDGATGPKGGTGNPVRTLIEYVTAL
jgi:leucyl aminopeptidase